MRRARTRDAPCPRTTQLAACPTLCVDRSVTQKCRARGRASSPTSGVPGRPGAVRLQRAGSSWVLGGLYCGCEQGMQAAWGHCSAAVGPATAAQEGGCWVLMHLRLHVWLQWEMRTDLGASNKKSARQAAAGGNSATSTSQVEDTARISRCEQTTLVGHHSSQPGWSSWCCGNRSNPSSRSASPAHAAVWPGTK